MNIDFSNKPEGATHVRIYTYAAVTGLDWYRREGSVWLFWSTSREWKNVYQNAPIQEGLIEIPVYWNGEGKPPIGKATCEYLGARQYDVWTVVNIFAHWGNDVFVDYGDGWRAERDLKRFRPIRTPEQIAADDRRNSAIALYGAVMDHSGQAFDRLPKERQEHYLKLVDQGWQQVPRA